MAVQSTTHEEPDPSSSPGPSRAPGDGGSPDVAAVSPDVMAVPPDVVAESLGGAYWWVDDCRWAAVQPTLPDDLVELLAPPILVGAVRVPAPVPAALPATP